MATPDPLSDDDILRMAKARIGFRTHAFVYLAVNLLLAAIWFVTSGGARPTLFGQGGASYWPIWTHLGWGLGLALHAFFVYGPGPRWEDREVARLKRKYGR